MADNKNYQDIVYEGSDWKDIDSEELHKELKAQLGDKFLGISTAGDQIIIHTTLDAQGAEKSKARQAFDAHDKSKLPPKPVRKTVEEQLAEMADKIARLEAKNERLEAQVAKPTK